MAAIITSGVAAPAATSKVPTRRIRATTTYIMILMMGFIKARMVNTCNCVQTSAPFALPKRSFFFIALTDAGLDDADAGDILLQDGVNCIQLRLQPGKQWVCLCQTEPHTADNQRKRAQCNEAEPRIEPEQKENAAKHQHPGANHTADKLRNQILHLCDVIGHTCDQ